MGNPEQQQEKPKAIAETAPQDVSNFLTNNEKHLTDAITGAFSILTKLFKDNQGNPQKTADAFQKTDYYKQFFTKDKSIQKLFELNYRTTESGRHAIKQFIAKLKLPKTAESILFDNAANPLRLSQTGNSDFRNKVSEGINTMDEELKSAINEQRVHYNDLNEWAKSFAKDFPKKYPIIFSGMNEGYTYSDSRFESIQNNEILHYSIHFTKKGNKIIPLVTESNPSRESQNDNE